MRKFNNRVKELEEYLRQPPASERNESIMEIEFRNYHKLPENKEKVNYLICLFELVAAKIAGEDIDINFDFQNFLKTFECNYKPGMTHVSSEDFVELSYDYAFGLNPELLEESKKMNFELDTKFLYAEIEWYRGMACQFLHDSNVYETSIPEFLKKYHLEYVNEEIR